MKSILALGLIFLAALGCQQKPTVTVTEGGVLLQNRDYRQAIQPEAVLFDTRSPFEFNISKVPGSINLLPSDFVVKKDPLDAARRLSLYGVNPEVPVVIMGENSDEGQREMSKLAWEFAQLGLKKVETLKISVFRTLNVRPEPSRKNVPLWKPTDHFRELSQKEFFKKIEESRPKPQTRARVEALQGVAPSVALRERVLVIRGEGTKISLLNYPFVIEREFKSDIALFDQQGLLKANSEWTHFLNQFDQVYLVDDSKYRYGRAFALSQWGAKSLALIDL